MQKKNKKIIIVIIVLLLSQNIIQSQNKRKLALLENTPNEATLIEPNIPVVSAGMIPVKYENGFWTITTKDDTDWYDYKRGKPAYIMLNDGYYKSELERGIEENQLMQNNVGVGVPDDPFSDITNPNRIILKIITQNNQEPIKAKGSHNEDTGLITIQVTYSRYRNKQNNIRK